MERDISSSHLKSSAEKNDSSLPCSSESESEEEEDCGSCLNREKVEKRTFESVISTQNQGEESSGQSSSRSEESLNAESQEEVAVTSTTSQGDITVELVPYGGETSDLKKLTLVIQGENKSKKNIKEQEVTETKEIKSASASSLSEDIPNIRTC